MNDQHRLDPLATIAALWIAGMASGLCLVSVLTRTWFDTDPALDPTRLPGLTPPAAMLLQLTVIVAAALVLLRSPRGINLGVVVASLLPVPIIIFWSAHGAHQLQWGLPWFTAIIAGVALAHVCADRSMRNIVLAVLVSGAGALVVQAAMQWGYELPAAARYFDQHRREILASLGIEPESPEALVYERGVTGGGPMGWFTSSNLMGSILAAMAIAWTGLVVSAKKMNRSPLVGGAGGALALGSALLATATGSMGAIVVLVIGLVFVIAGMVAPRVRLRGGAIGLVLMGLAFASPLVVSQIGALDGLAGVRSLDIRWQYDVGSVRMVEAHPLVGVGPAGFQNAYPQFRLPGAVEEVATAHAMVFEWTATMGLLALAWVALVAWLVWSVDRSTDPPIEPRRDHVLLAATGGIVAVVPAVVSLGSEVAVLDAPAILMRIIGLLLCPLVAVVALRCMGTTAARWGVVVGAVMLVVHGQVEMTFAMPGTVLFTLALLGAVTVVPLRTHTVVGPSACVVLIVLCAGSLAWGVRPVWNSEAAQTQAAAILAAGPPTPQGRLEAASLLESAARLTGDPRPLHSAIEQDLIAAQMQPSRVDALAALARARARRPEADDVVGSRLTRDVLWAHGSLTDDETDLSAAVAAARRTTALDPQDPLGWIMLARLLEQAGQDQEASRAWRQALALDDLNEMDVLRKLPSALRRQAEQGAQAP